MDGCMTATRTSTEGGGLRAAASVPKPRVGADQRPATIASPPSACRHVEHEDAGQRRVHGDEHERDRVHAAELGDLDHRQPQVLRVPERAPREAPQR